MSRRTAELLLISIAVAWGFSWMFMKMGLEGLSPFNIVFLRFGVAFVVVGLLFFKRLRGMNKKTIRSAIISGTILFGVTTCVLYGLTTTMASTGGFLISVSTVFVALIQLVLVRKFPGIAITLSVLLMVVGVYFLTGAQGFDFDIGSLWILLAAFLNAVYITYVGRVPKEVDTFQLGTVQLGVAALLALAGTLITGTLDLPHSTSQWIGVLGLGIVCTAYCFVMQPVAQQHSTPERAGVYWSSEALFAAIFAFIFLGERFAPLNYLGAALIFSAVIIALLDWEKIGAKFARKKKPEESG